MLIHSLPMKSGKRLSRDVFDTFATHASLVYDVIDTDSWAQNGSIHGPASALLSSVDFQRTG